MTEFKQERGVVVIVDPSRGFMPKEEGERLRAMGNPDWQGFGELPVPHGEEIVDATIQLIRAAQVGGYAVILILDDHPEETAHFGNPPDFVTSWPVHCVAGTPGARPHPDIEAALPEDTIRLYKGQEPLQPGEEDLSYSGWHATDRDGRTLGEYLPRRDDYIVIMVGNAFDYCLGSSAHDVRVNTGLPVIVVEEGTRSIAPESEAAMRQKLHGDCVQIASLEQTLEIMS